MSLFSLSGQVHYAKLLFNKHLLNSEGSYRHNGQTAGRINKPGASAQNAKIRQERFTQRVQREFNQKHCRHRSFTILSLSPPLLNQLTAGVYSFSSAEPTRFCQSTNHVVKTFKSAPLPAAATHLSHLMCTLQ